MWYPQAGTGRNVNDSPKPAPPCVHAVWIQKYRVAQKIWGVPVSGAYQAGQLFSGNVTVANYSDFPANFTSHSNFLHQKWHGTHHAIELHIAKLFLIALLKNFHDDLNHLMSLMTCSPPVPLKQSTRQQNLPTQLKNEKYTKHPSPHASMIDKANPLNQACRPSTLFSTPAANQQWMEYHW